MHPAADHAARQAARVGSRTDMEPLLPQREDLDTADTVVGQVENSGLRALQLQDTEPDSPSTTTSP